MSQIKAVLFDLDGVLIDATDWHYEALNRALAMFGFSISRYDHLSSYNGLPTRKKLEMLSVEKGLPGSLHNMINRIKQVYTREEILRHCWPTFEKEYLLSRLKREGYRVAVCSNAIRDSVELMLRRSALFDYFEFVISNEEVKQAKPHPEIYLKALARLELSPAEVVVVEDAPHGIEAANASGVNVLQVSGHSEVNYEHIREFINSIEKPKEVLCYK